MQDEFYIRFENRFRGPEVQIKKQLQQYAPLLKALEKTPQPVALDLGCGRGEWLQILAKRNWVSSGIDLNASMVKYCQKKGLKAEQVDALEYLKSLKDQSLNLVTGFHIAEHVPFNVLLEIVQQVYRVLRPEGILLLETPNPENLQVGSHTFYMDPSHLHPLPPQLLQFIAQDQGFIQADICRLNGSERPTNKMAFGDHLQWFFEANLDYALIAQKQKNLISGQELNKIGEADNQYAEFYQITRDYVEETHQRIAKNKHQQETTQQEVKRVIEHLQEKVEVNETNDNQHLLARIEHLQEKAEINEQKVKQLEARAIKLPRLLRSIPKYYQEFGFIGTLKHSQYRVLNGLAKRILANTQFTQYSLKYLNKSPKLKAYLKQILAPKEGNVINADNNQPKQLQVESPRALKILQDIQHQAKTAQK